MKLGWKRSPRPAPGGGAPSATAPLSATAPSAEPPSATAPLSATAPSAEPCGRRFAPRVIRSSYWVRSSLITETSVVCSNCGRPLDPARANGH